MSFPDDRPSSRGKRQGDVAIKVDALRPRRSPARVCSEVATPRRGQHTFEQKHREPKWIRTQRMCFAPHIDEMRSCHCCILLLCCGVFFCNLPNLCLRTFQVDTAFLEICTTTEPWVCISNTSPISPSSPNLPLLRFRPPSGTRMRSHKLERFFRNSLPERLIPHLHVCEIPLHTLVIHCRDVHTSSVFDGGRLLERVLVFHILVFGCRQ